jgi:hypothetical protein
VTIILLPLGIPLLGLSRRLMGVAVRLMLPRAVAHPVKETKKGLKSSGDKATRKTKEAGKAGKKAGREAGKKAGRKSRKRLPLG